ncbi:hypothetical protein CN152_25045 [Sinorhizobium meliloti]|nr:hypothetical protein CN152_25045 [Sinorhizobium meliloti]RVN44883.1 hypothetical protein CN113_19890 [Sinorhizobium meliloti]
MSAIWPLFPARPKALFKAMLLSIWNDLSDVKLAEALKDMRSRSVSSSPAMSLRTSILFVHRLHASTAIRCASLMEGISRRFSPPHSRVSEACRIYFRIFDSL